MRKETISIDLLTLNTTGARRLSKAVENKISLRAKFGSNLIGSIREIDLQYRIV